MRHYKNPYRQAYGNACYIEGIQTLHASFDLNNDSMPFECSQKCCFAWRSLSVPGIWVNSGLLIIRTNTCTRQFARLRTYIREDIYHEVSIQLQSCILMRSDPITKSIQAEPDAYHCECEEPFRRARIILPLSKHQIRHLLFYPL